MTSHKCTNYSHGCCLLSCASSFKAICRQSKMTFLFAVCVILIESVYAADQNFTDPSSSVKVKVLGKSGKFFFGYSAKDFEDASGTIQITMDSLVEKMQNDSRILESNHSYNTFANQDFSITEPKSEMFMKIPTMKITFSSILANKAELKVDIYVIKENGSYKDAYNDIIQLKKGMLKWTIEIKNWKFSDQVGDSLDLTITVKGKSAAKKRSAMEYTLGGNAVISLNNKVDVNGKYTRMAADYPKHVATGSKDQFIFKFPLFTDDCRHDPTLDLGGDTTGVETTPKTTPTATTMNTTSPNKVIHNTRTGAASHLPWIAMIFSCSALVKIIGF